MDESFLSQYDIKSSKGMKLSLAVNKDGAEEMLDFPFKDGLVELPDNWDATFDIVTGDDMILPCKCSKDPIFGGFFWLSFYLLRFGRSIKFLVLLQRLNLNHFASKASTHLQDLPAFDIW